jgi:hypothetical protein
MEQLVARLINIGGRNNYPVRPFAKKVDELINTASATKTAPAPNPPAITPATAGKRNCPSRFPARRTLIANDRSSSREIRDTQAIVNG